MMYNSDITKQKTKKRRKKGKNKMIEREFRNEYYYYINNHVYCRDCWEYNNRQWLEYLENKKKTSYEIEEIIDDFLNN